MSDLDLVGLRKIAEAARKMWGNLIPVHGAREYQRATGPKTVLALLDRIVEQDKQLAEYRERAERAEGKLTDIREQHRRIGTQARSFCVQCDEAWPCRTVKTLKGDDT